MTSAAQMSPPQLTLEDAVQLAQGRRHRVLEAVIAMYERMVRTTVRHAALTMLVSFGVVVGSVYLGTHLGTEFILPHASQTQKENPSANLRFTEGRRVEAEHVRPALCQLSQSSVPGKLHTYGTRVNRETALVTTG